MNDGAARRSGLEAPVFSAVRIAEILAPPGEPPRLPTAEQAQIIEQPLAGSVLVIAGAGSGKTETMANRVVWLIANGLAEPSEILGLTFTRKAAGELGERIAGRLLAFAERLADLRSLGRLSAAEGERAEALRALMADGLELPEVGTYNAFASAVVQEFGSLAGVAASATVVDEATAWRIARDIVCRSEDPELVESEYGIPALVKQVIELDHAVSDNLTTFDAVEAAVVEFEAAEGWSFAGNRLKQPYADVLKAVGAVRATRVIARLAREFSAEKRRRGLIEFSDQLALAVETLSRSGDAVRVLRERSPVVLLDEVQDTSVGQSRLLSTLFAGSSVMAVGDPHQSIYGFRGASASNLLSFHRDFAAGASGGRDLSLSVSWRNPTEVLRAANRISAPLSRRLRAEAGRGAVLDVRELESREQHFARDSAESTEPADSPSAVEWRFPETVDEEFAQLAGWMAEAREEHLRRTGELPSAAVVFRSRGRMPAVQAALHEAGVPSRIVGVGGLLTTPEIRDLVSALRCIWYADASSDLIRILAGPRFRLGVKDLDGLRSAARWFAERDPEMQPLDEEDRRGSGRLSDSDREVTLLDALDEIAGMARLDRPSLAGISESGRPRLRDAGQMLRRLRQGVGGNLLDLLRAVEYELRLDIELEANERNGHRGSAVARANLDAFADLVEAFLATDEQGTLAAVLEWLERVAEADEIAEHVPEPEPGTVQLITAHGAKGLEWDLVAIPRLVEQEFPSPSREGLGWLRPGQLPDELRGDIAARPRLDWAWLRSQADQKSLVEAMREYQAALKDRHADEERRLAYVAVTRAASRLLLTGSWWGGTKTPRGPSPYLRELAEDGIVSGLPEESAHASDPNEHAGRTLSWPLDPLGARGAAVLAAAEAVREALLGEANGGARIDPVVELLLAEHRAASNAPAGPTPSAGAALPAGATLPERITASAFHEFVESPLDAERQRLRPLPVRPYRRTRIGNRFHEWVERRATTARGTALALPGLALPALTLSGLDPEEPGSDIGLDDDGVHDGIGAGDDELQPLIEQFERSRWAHRQPIAVELEVSLPFAGRTLVCKLDAVYRDGEGEGARYEVVDWKSGRPPRDETERASRFLQLDLYRHAYARWAGVDPDRIDVSLFYVAEGEELRGEGGRSLEELERLWLDASTRIGEAL